MSVNSAINMPIVPPPPGYTRNLDNPPNQDLMVILVMALCLGAATSLVLIRLFVNTVVTKQRRWDDGLVLVSLLLFIVWVGLQLNGLKFGSTVDIWNLRLDSMIRWSRNNWILGLIYTITIFGVKVSVLILYKRIFVPLGTTTWLHHTITFFIVFKAVSYFVSLLTVAFDCIPRQRNWDPFVPGRCLDPLAVIIGTSVLNITSDTFTIVIPIAVLWRLKIARKRKGEILILFGFGFLSLICCIMRLVFSLIFWNAVNKTVALAHTSLWATAEITSCLLAACVPMVPLMIHHSRTYFGQTKPDWSTPFQLHQRQKPYKPRRISAVDDSLFGSTLRDDDKDREESYRLHYVETASDSVAASPETRSMQGSGAKIVVSKTVSISTVPAAFYGTPRSSLGFALHEK